MLTSPLPRVPTVVATILILHRLLLRFPGPLLAVIGAMAASAAFNFSAHGITVIGPVAAGLPLTRDTGCALG